MCFFFVVVVFFTVYFFVFDFLCNSCGLSHNTNTYCIFIACILISFWVVYMCVCVLPRRTLPKSVSCLQWNVVVGTSQCANMFMCLIAFGFLLCCRVFDFIFNNVKQTFRSAFGFLRHLCLFSLCAFNSNFIFTDTPFSSLFRYFVRINLKYM